MGRLTSTERSAMIEVPEAFLDRVDAVASAVLGRRDATGAELGRRVSELSELYTRERGSLEEADPAENLAARLRFYLPRDLPKVTGPLSELAAAGALPAGRDGAWRVLDLGAGCGATTFGTAAFARSHDAARRLEVVAIDRDALALRCMRELAGDAAAASLAPIEVDTRTGDLSTAPDGPFDLVLLGLVLNELGDDLDKRARLLTSLGSRLADDGAIVVIEPALRDVTRALHAVRDRIVADSTLGVFAPCLRGGACPMLESDRDWCHEDVPARLPERLVSVARTAGLRYERLTYSYLTLRRDSRSLREIAAGAPGEPYRLVSQPRPTKGKLEVFGCGEPGRIRIVRLRRHRSERSAALDEARRGDILAVEGSPDDRGRLRLGPDAAVEFRGS